MSEDAKSNMNILYIALAILLTLLVISQVQKNYGKSNFNEASDDISEGIDNVADSFDSRGPVEKTSDSIKDATN